MLLQVILGDKIDTEQDRQRADRPTKIAMRPRWVRPTGPHLYKDADMAEFHYWEPVRYDSNLVTGLPAKPYGAVVSPSRTPQDTLLRHIHFPTLVTTVDVSGGVFPDWSWWGGATVMLSTRWDTDGSKSPGNDEWGDPNSLGSVRLLPTLISPEPTKSYTVVWQGPAEGINFRGPRKGSSSNPDNALIIAIWALDVRNVFWNLGDQYPVTHHITNRSRALFGSESPS